MEKLRNMRLLAPFVPAAAPGLHPLSILMHALSSGWLKSSALCFTVTLSNSCGQLRSLHERPQVRYGLGMARLPAPGKHTSAGSHDTSADVHLRHAEVHL